MSGLIIQFTFHEEKCVVSAILYVVAVLELYW